MADVSTLSANAENVSTPKKSSKKEKKSKVGAKVSHPSTAVMVNAAIESLKERGGSSLQAIKKYISATYKIDGEKFSPFIKKYLKSAVVSGALVQTKGKGASGSFKLATNVSTKKTTSKVVTKTKKVAVKPKPKTATVAKDKKVSTQPAKKVKKAAVPAIKKTIKESTKSKSAAKAKTTKKLPTKKPKSPKPKSAKSKVVKKKTTPKKK